MAAGSVFSGIIRGFGNTSRANRAETTRLAEAQMDRDQRKFEFLITSDDPEISNAAAAGLESIALGTYQPGKGLSKFLGGDVQLNPGIARLFDLIRSPQVVGAGMPVRELGAPPRAAAQTQGAAMPAQAASEAGGGPPSPAALGSPAAPGGATTPAPTSLPTPQALRSPVAGPAPTDPRALGGSGITSEPLPPPGQEPAASPAPAPQVPGQGDPGAAAGQPPPLPTLSGSPIDEGIPFDTTTGRLVGRTQGAKMKRQVFLPNDQRIRRDTLAREGAENESEHRYLRSLGFSDEEIRELKRAEVMGRSRGSIAQGTVQSVLGQMPDGTLTFGILDKRPNSPTFGRWISGETGEPLIGFVPPESTASFSAGGMRESLARAFFGGSFASLDQAQQQQVITMETELLQDQAFSRGTGTGEAAANTAMAMPLSPAEAALQEVPFGTSMETLRGWTPITPQQRERRDSVLALTPDLQLMRELVEEVFPESGTLSTMMESLGLKPLAGMTDVAMASAILRSKRASADVAFGRLEAVVESSLGNLARVRNAETGRLTEQDVDRARKAVTDLQGWTDTRELALAKLDDAEAALTRIADAIQSPGDLLAGQPPPGAETGGLPEIGPFDLSTLPPNMQDAMSAIPVPDTAGAMDFDVTVDGQTITVRKYTDGRFERIK